MKALYITSMHRFGGKTAFSLALGRRLKKEGYNVGFFKPVSAQPWEPLPGEVYDDDASFVRNILEIPEPIEKLVGIVLTPSLVMSMRCGCSTRDLMGKVTAAYHEYVQDKDFVIVEGGASLREGLSLGLSPIQVANALDLPVLTLVRFRNYVSAADACIEAKSDVGERLLGSIINLVTDDAYSFMKDDCLPCLEKQSIPILGVIPFREQLQAISVGEIAELLSAEFLTLPEKKDELIEEIIVGAMSVEKALPYIRRVLGRKALITGGDRADMQLIGLETSMNCLILTGNLHPVPEVLHRAEEVGVPVLSIRHNTMEAVEAIDAVMGKTRLGQIKKLEKFESLLEEHVDFVRLYAKLGL
ncbi:MAG: phosphotransacetylase family protein [Anaerolineae bacterium]|nr:phosphotransacetylase family protein [Anaerolineae bacterium]